MKGSVNNDKIDLCKCYDKVNPRASKIDCADFECSLESFKTLEQKIVS